MIAKEDCIKIGTITKTHSLDGQVVVTTDNDLLEKYVSEPVFVLLDGAPVPFFIAPDGLVTRNHTSYIVKFDYIDSPILAERLLGKDILLEKKLLKEEEKEEAEFDIFDLNGFDVEDVLSGEKGKITDVADYSGNVVFSIDIFGKEILLPLSENYIKEVSWDDKKIITSIPRDIIDLY